MATYSHGDGGYFMVNRPISVNQSSLAKPYYQFFPFLPQSKMIV